MCRGVVAGGLLLASAWVLAQGYPARPVTLVVPFGAGGSSDSIARTIAPKLSERLGQPVVIENLAGAGGVVGAGRVVRAAPDGYVLLLGSGSEILINKLINPATPYDALTDLASIAFVSTGPMVLIGHPSLPAANVTELLRFARARPGVLNYASAGNGTPMHVAGELLNIRGNVALVHIPYKGAPPAIADIIGGQVHLGFSTLSVALPFIQAGKLRAYGLSTLTRAETAPQIVPLGEVKELAGFDLGVWWGLFAPAKTPRAVLDKVEQEALFVLRQPDVREKLAQQSITPVGQPAAALDRFMRAEVQSYRKVIETAGIKAD